MSMAGIVPQTRLTFFVRKKKEVKVTLEFLKKYKKFETQVIESTEFNKFN
jgi:hypothetical protein